MRNLTVPKMELKAPVIDKKHQEDATRRDKLHEAAAPTRILKRGETEPETPEQESSPVALKRTPRENPKTPTLAPNFKKQRHIQGGVLPKDLYYTPGAPLQSNDKMDEEAGLPVKSTLRKKPSGKKETTLVHVDIALLEAGNFLRNAKRKDVVIGATSIYEVDRLIQDKKGIDLLPDDEDDLKQLVSEKLPEEYADFADVFSKAASDTLPPHRENVDHDIILEADNNLVPSPLYSMSLEQLEAVKVYLEDHLKRGFIVPSGAPYASPVLFAKKPGGGWRFCVDYRRLNEITKKDKYPLPLIEETLARLGRAKVFTKLDVRQAFYRIRMKESVEELTTFRTRYGSYKYKVLPFGLCNGPASFQRFINDTLFDFLDDFCTAYVDDILIYSEDPLEHEEQVRKVLQRLRDAGLQADIKKSEFSVQSTKFLGFIISTTGISMDPEKVAVIRDWELPKSVKEIQSFLGFCNFYRLNLKNWGRVVRPLTKLTNKGAWHPLGEIETQAFQRAKDLVLSDAVRAHYSPFRSTRTETDASDGVIAGVLTQLQEDAKWRPVAYYSKTMSPEEMRYEIHDKEMLAVVRALQEWRGMLLGLQEVPFIAITDHRALEYFTTKRLLNPRQARWADVVADYNFKITYRPGTANVVADALTRKHGELITQKEKDIASRTQCFLDPKHVLASIEEATTERENEITAPKENKPYEVVDAVLNANRTHPSLAPYKLLADQDKRGWKLEKDLLTRFGRLMVPEEAALRTSLINEAHSTQTTAHPGRGKTAKLLSAQYYWPGLANDCARFVANCRTCRRTHVPRDRAPGLLHPLPIAQRCWQHVSFDFKSFPKDKKGFDNVFVIVDRFGKRAFSLPCEKTISAAQAAELYYQHVWRIYGTPETATSDRGPQFISAFTDELCKLTGVKQKLSTAYHPQTDGNTEVLNQYIDQRLRPFVNHFQDNWSSLLPAMDFAQASLPHSSTGMSPYELELGYAPRMHFDWKERTTTSPTIREQLTREEAQAFASRTHEAVKWATENLKLAQERQTVQANRHRREPDFTTGDWVYVTRKGWTTTRPSLKLDHQSAGPYQITGMKGYSYVLDLPKHMKMSNVFHADRLRKAADDPMPGQIEDPEPAIEVNGEPEYVVDKVLASRVKGKTLQYQVAWQGYDPDSAWYDASGFIGAPHKVKAYHDDNPDEPGPPLRLDVWLKAYLEEEDLEPTKEDNLPRKHAKNRKLRRKS